MNWTDYINDIKSAQEKNQLVVFVGAGVSKNSNVPTWWELIKKIADEVGYKKCVSCKKRTEMCPIAECEDQYAFTQDEFLRIPEYYWGEDDSANHAAYYTLIQDTLNSNNGPNPIDEEIFNLLPHHVITTNYDTLLEDSKNLNARLYSVVSKDSDLLSKADEQYIIKMHGDINTPDTIVLKESDYIHYEQQHPLISTFIRSLLINHTFLFLGYSLNDYNLNLIIGWINYFQNHYGVEERPHNFLVTSEASTKFEAQRLASKNIFVIDLSSMPGDLPEKACAPDILPNLTGRKLYSFLKSITDSRILQHYMPLEEILVKKYQVLRSYKKISFEDLIQVQPLGRTAFKGTALIFYEDEWYQQLSSIIKEGNPELIDTLQRTGITTIQSFHGKTSTEVPRPSEDADMYFQLYLNNSYVELANSISICSDASVRLYYHHLLGESMETIEQDIEWESSLIPKDDYISVLLHKMRARIATLSWYDSQQSKTQELEQLFSNVPVKYRDAITYLKMLFEAPAKNKLKMEELLKKQEEKYKTGNHTLYFEHSYTNIWDLQAYAYDYYSYSKMNCLPMDYFSDPKEYFSYYLKAILCSYSSIAPVSSESAYGLSTDRRHYPLSEIDLDILIKYADTKSLKIWLETYRVQFLEFQGEVNLTLKYKNICNNIACLQVDYPIRQSWLDQLFNLLIVICLSPIPDSDKIVIFEYTESMLRKTIESNPRNGEILFEILNYLIKHLNVERAEDIKADFADDILSKDVYPLIRERHSYMFSDTLKRLSPCVRDGTKERLTRNIQNTEVIAEKIDAIILFREIIPIDRYADILNSNIKLISTESLFHLLIEGTLKLNQQIVDRFIETIEFEVKKRKENPSLHSLPDWLTASIEECILLKLFGFEIDLELLRPYAHYSNVLQFILCPDNFDYSEVDLNHYMWQNLIYSQQYMKCFIEHKDEILSDDLIKVFNMGLETREQQKIVYGLLIEKEGLRRFGNEKN